MPYRPEIDRFCVESRSEARLLTGAASIRLVNAVSALSPCTSDEVADFLVMPRTTARARLDRLAHAGLMVVREEDGRRRYELRAWKLEAHGKSFGRRLLSAILSGLRRDVRKGRYADARYEHLYARVSDEDRALLEEHLEQAVSILARSRGRATGTPVGLLMFLGEMAVRRGTDVAPSASSAGIGTATPASAPATDATSPEEVAVG